MTNYTCKDCKKPYEPTFIRGIKSSTRCRVCTNKFDRAKKKKQLEKQKVRKKVKKENNIPRLKKELDRVFSIYIRQRDSNKLGFLNCPCCSKRLHWKDAQNMHYVSRGNMNTRYDERNCWAGCVGCNVFKSGNYPAYTDFLLRTYGEEWLKGLIKDGNKSRKFTPIELKELIEHYKNLIK